MSERSTATGVMALGLLMGLTAGALVEVFGAPFGAYLGVGTSVVFGLGIAFLEGPALVVSIVLPRRITRMWVRNALEAGGPFLSFVGYVLAYGTLLHPPFAIPWP